MLRDFNFNVSADASSLDAMARELMAMKAAIGFILSSLPADAQNHIVQNLLDIPNPQAKDLGSTLNQFKHIREAD